MVANDEGVSPPVAFIVLLGLVSRSRFYSHRGFWQNARTRITSRPDIMTTPKTHTYSQTTFLPCQCRGQLTVRTWPFMARMDHTSTLFPVAISQQSNLTSSTFCSAEVWALLFHQPLKCLLSVPFPNGEWNYCRRWSCADFSV